MLTTRSFADKFTGKERDSESGLDNFLARYFTSNFGRFLSPDPENAGADAGNPQSWNAYSYALNDPVDNTDPDGRDTCQGRDPGSCVEVTAAGPDDEVTYSYSFRRITLRQLSNAAQRANDYLRTAWDWWRTSQINPGCLAAATASGAAFGASQGVVEGPALQVAFAYPSRGASMLGFPFSGAGLGAAAGGAAGGGIGYGIGWLTCRTGAPGGGGGGRATGRAARLTRPQQRQTAKYLGMKEVKGVYSDGELVFEKDGRYFSFSNTSHTAGEVFKEVDRNGNRIATTDLNLNRIGN
jgi:RHS repeat-associated protein